METSIDWFSLISGIAGGLVFFLYGMDVMSNALKSGLGDNIRRLITKLNANNFTLMFTGIIVTVITQSTGATTVMLMSFVEAGIMKFAETVAVILGACIGSSVISQIIAFDIAGYAILPVIIGFLMKSASKNDTIRDTGNAIFGFGLVFFGMQYLGRSVSVLKDIPEFTNAIASAGNPLLGLLVGTIATCIMQSTGMFAGILMVFAKEGLIDIYQAYPLVIGSTLGTCLLIVIASAGASTQSKRTMMAHVLTKATGAVIFMAIMPLSVKFLEWATSAIGASPERTIANIHLFFNVGEAFTLLPFCGLFVKVIEKWIKQSPTKPKLQKGASTGHLKFININFIAVPQTAIEASIAETRTLIKLSSRMFDKAMSVFDDYNPDDIDKKRNNQKMLKKLQDKEDKFMFLEDEVREYLFAVRRMDVKETATQQTFGLLSVLENAKRIVELIKRRLIPLYDKLCLLEITFSIEGKSEIQVFTFRVATHFNDIDNALANQDAEKLLAICDDIEITKKNVENLRISHLKRFINDDKNHVAVTHEVHTELINALSDISMILSLIVSTFTKSIIVAEKKISHD